jgi:hypothetical protein
MYEEGMIMGKVSMGIISLAFLLALVVILTVPATTSLIPTNFGFPAMVHSGQAVSFSNDLVSSTDSESMNIGFHPFDGLMSPSGMPSTGMNNWPMQGMTAPDLSHMGKLFDFSGFKFH